jgi:hypothetical protein
MMRIMMKARMRTTMTTAMTMRRRTTTKTMRRRTTTNDDDYDESGEEDDGDHNDDSDDEDDEGETKVGKMKYEEMTKAVEIPKSELCSLAMTKNYHPSNLQMMMHNLTFLSPFVVGI